MAAQPPRNQHHLDQVFAKGANSQARKTELVMVQKLRSILLIDDDESSHYMTSLVIKQKSITEHIHFAESADKALRYLKHLALSTQSPPELILIDIEMPEMDGLEFVDQLRRFKLKPAPFVAFLSGHAKDYGAVKRRGIPILSKPLTEGDLCNLVIERFADHFVEGAEDNWRSPGSPETSGLTLF